MSDIPTDLINAGLDLWGGEEFDLHNYRTITAAAQYITKLESDNARLTAVSEGFIAEIDELRVERNMLASKLEDLRRLTDE